MTSNPTRVKNTARVHFVSGFAEILFILSTLTIGTPLIASLQHSLIPPPTINDSIQQIITNIIIMTALKFLLIYIIMSLISYNFQITIKEIAVKMGLHHIQLSPIIPLIIVFHSIGICLLFQLQSYFGENILTLENITLGKNASLKTMGELNLNWIAICNLFILSPILEEIVCRGLIFLTLFRHLNPMNMNSKKKKKNTMVDENMTAMKRSIILCAVIFGFIHMCNLFGTQYSLNYCLLQIVSGCVISLFYTLRLVISQSIWEPIILHSINNLFSVFVSFTNDDVMKAIVLYPILCSLMCYALLSYWMWTHDIRKINIDSISS